MPIPVPDTIAQIWSETARYRLRYARLREDVYQSTLAGLVPFLDAPLTDLTPIDSTALRAWEAHWRPAVPDGLTWSDWNWRDEVSGWQKHVDHFEVAIWSGGDLCGLAVGKPSERRNNMSLYLIQGSPIDNHPLKGRVIPIALDAAAAYGRALNCNELRLIRPLSGMVGKYQRLGFRLESQSRSAPYCVRPL